jgi:acyl carrier protein
VLDDRQAQVRIRDILDGLWPDRFASDQLIDDAPLGEDGLGLDSVEMAEFLIACENEYGVMISEELFAAVAPTVGGVAEYFGAA